jgi:nucleoside 2-deoxyribosyltransferase
MIELLAGRNIQIAGSINQKARNKDAIFSHKVVRTIAYRLLQKGAALVSMVDEEPRLDPAERDSPAAIFYWDVIESACQYMNSNAKEVGERILLHLVCSDQSVNRVPKHRKQLWQKIMGSKHVCLHKITPGWTSSYLIRKKQEELSDAVVILGGSQGIEQSVSLYISHGKSVMPLNIPLGSNTDDGSCVASRFFSEAVSRPDIFFPRSSETLSSSLQALSYAYWEEKPENYAKGITDLLSGCVKPQIFCARLLNSKSKRYKSVEKFCHEIVFKTAESKGYKCIEIGRSRSRKAFLNVEIFSELNRSSILIVDLTGVRSNCLIELGYGLGLGKNIILTARQKTRLPFDIDKIPVFFWDIRKDSARLMKEFNEHWQINLGTPSFSDL